MKSSIRFLQVLGTASLALLVACGDSSSSLDEGPPAAGAAGATAGSGGKAGKGGTGGKAQGGAGQGGNELGGAGQGGKAQGGAGQGGEAQGGEGGEAQGGEGGEAQGGEAGQAQGGEAGQAQGGEAGQAQGGEAGQAQGGGGQAQGGGGQAQGGGGQAQGGSNSGGFCPFPPCDNNGGSNQGGSGGGSGTCNSKPGEDKDGDGYPFPQDCNDCDPATNPGALDVFNYDPNTGAPLPKDKQVDEDCDGTPTLVEKPVCDSGLTLAENDAVKGANAIDICQTTTANSPKWGILSAAYTQLNGNPLPGGGNAQLGHGIMASFGPNVQKQLGANMLVLSSGAARTPGQTGYNDPSGFSKGYTTTNPPGFPVNSPSCPSNVQSGTLNDSIGLKLRMRAPTNAKSISFKFKFYTYEYPNYICSSYNDIFVAIMRDKDGKFIQGANQQTGNISFDKDGNYLSVNAGFLEVCTPGNHGGKNFACPLGTSELQGTGFDDGTNSAATGWLQTNAPVKPGEEFDIIFGISDAGDGVLDSTVLLDSFEWSANEGEVQTGNECVLGGSGTCASCLSKQIPTCCSAEYNTCINDKEGDSGNFNPGCNGILNCIQICAGNAQCQQNCYDTRPKGQAEYNTYRDCLYGPAGSQDDFGACGKVCN